MANERDRKDQTQRASQMRTMETTESIHKKRRWYSIAAYEQISDLFVVDLEHR